MAAVDPSLPFSKISIPGPTLSSLLHHSLSSSSSSSAISGLLFGHVARLPSPDPTDADPTPSFSSSPSLSLTITSFLSSPQPLPFFTPLGVLDPTSPLKPNPNPSSSSSSAAVGWFSSRPRSPLRPSMRELAVSHHLAGALTLAPTKACVFLLLSSFSTSNQAVHTHEYRAYVVSGSAPRPVSVDVINVGPKFRGQYGGFLPESSLGLFPLMACRAKLTEEEGEGFMETESSQDCENGEERALVEGFGPERLEGLAGERAAEYAREVEELYAKMMGKLEGLVRLVEASSLEVQEQV